MATEVEFHTGVADPVAFACRLLRKAMRSGAQLVCTAPAATLDVLDRALWVFDERDFVPHLRLPAASTAVAARSPIWLCLQAGPEAGDRVLVNLGAPAPANPAGVARVIEVVGSDDEAVASGRERWRGYKAAGLEIRHHAAAGSNRRGGEAADVAEAP